MNDIAAGGSSATRTLARRHVVPHFTTGAAWREDDFLVPVRGEGVYLWDAEGRRYLDGLSGLFCSNLGYGRSDLVAAATRQLEQLPFMPNWGAAHPMLAEAASRLAAVTPGDLDRVFFVNSGSEAVEAALKLARTYHLARGEDSRYKVIARDFAYHGTTLGALVATGVPKMREPFRPLIADASRHVPNTAGVTLAEGADAASLACVRAVEEAILAEGPETVSMVIAEPVQNGGGAIVPLPGYWAELRRICDKYGVLLCADEVICGFGRLGHWFGSQRFDVVPDLLTFAKGATAGYAPLGGVAAKPGLVDTVLDSPLRVFLHGSTWGGHPASTAIVSAVITAMTEESVLDNVLDQEAYLAGRLRDLMAAHDIVAEVRGCGFFYALELTTSRAAGQPLTPELASALLGGTLVRSFREAGLYIRADDRGATSLVLSPPLVSQREHLDELVERVDAVLRSTAKFIASTADLVRS